LPVLVIAVAVVAQETYRRQRYKDARIETTLGKCRIWTAERQWQADPLVEIRIENRPSRRDGSPIVDGDIDSFLVTHDVLGKRFFFSLAPNGTADALTAISRTSASGFVSAPKTKPKAKVHSIMSTAPVLC